MHAACALPPSAPSAHGKDTLCPQRPSHLLRRCRGTPRRRANRASQGVIPHRWLISTIPTTAVTPHNNSDTPWGDSGLARSMSDMRVSPGASHRAGGPGGMVTGTVTRRGRGLTRPMEKPIHRWKRPSLMEEPLTNRRDADIDKRGAVKRRRVHTKPSMLATRPKLGNGNLQELNDEAKATRPPLCFCLALDRSGPSQPAADGASAQFPSPSFVSAHRRPLAPP